MNGQIIKLQKNIEEYRAQIINHKVYAVLNNVQDLQVFMKYHVYAVWDFMSLLKALQQNLTCVSVPWFPVGDADTRHLINEIVLGEESDVDSNGIQKSHFELYLDGMEQAGTSIVHIGKFIAELRASGNFDQAYSLAQTPQAAQQFVDFTFNVINGKNPAIQAAVFTFGREDLIPNMFLAIVEDIAKNSPDEVAIFKYYLQRHIEVDGDQHSALALQMTANLCGNDPEKWAQATVATILALQMRIKLWDGAYEEIMERHNN